MSDDKTEVLEKNPKAAERPALSAEEIETLTKKAAERDQYLDLAQRTRAEFDNYQKRARADRDMERKYAYGPLVRDLLPVIDNLERTLAAAQQAGDKGALVQGVAMVQSQFIDLLRRNGIVRIDAQDKPFDPNVHEAVTQLPSAKHEPNTVLQVLEQGFMNHDRVLRPAKVIVSKREG
jgi:molecular chaperone GrpE